MGLNANRSRGRRIAMRNVQRRLDNLSVKILKYTQKLDMLKLRLKQVNEDLKLLGEQIKTVEE